MSGSVKSHQPLASQAIVDLVSTGMTLGLNDLRPLEKIYDSQAVLIANEKTISIPDRQTLFTQLMARFN